MKKALAIVLVILLCFSLSGCRQKSLKEVLDDEFENVDKEKVKELREGLIDYHLGGY